MNDRLTARNKAGVAYLVNVKPNEQVIECQHEDTLECILDCFERLAQYEDAEQARETGCEYCRSRFGIATHHTTESGMKAGTNKIAKYCPMCGKRLEATHE